jgi:U3 small nucleolar RNA-associated protein 7
MITLDPEFVGSMAPLPRLAETDDGRTNIPYARLPRYERLRVSGKADGTEVEEGDEQPDAEEIKRTPNKLQDKKKMRGKGKSVKRFIPFASTSAQCRLTLTSLYKVPPQTTQERYRSGSGACSLLSAHCLSTRSHILMALGITQVAIRAKLEKQREGMRKARLSASGAPPEEGRLPSALDRFRRGS